MLFGGMRITDNLVVEETVTVRLYFANSVQMLLHLQYLHEVVTNGFFVVGNMQLG
jgi:hypothetical protein